MTYHPEIVCVLEGSVAIDAVQVVVVLMEGAVSFVLEDGAANTTLDGPVVRIVHMLITGLVASESLRARQTLQVGSLVAGRVAMVVSRPAPMGELLAAGAAFEVSEASHLQRRELLTDRWTPTEGGCSSDRTYR